MGKVWKPVLGKSRIGFQTSSLACEHNPWHHWPAIAQRWRHDTRRWPWSACSLHSHSENDISEAETYLPRFPSASERTRSNFTSHLLFILPSILHLPKSSQTWTWVQIRAPPVTSRVSSRQTQILQALRLASRTEGVVSNLQSCYGNQIRDARKFLAEHLHHEGLLQMSAPWPVHSLHGNCKLIQNI